MKPRTIIVAAGAALTVLAAGTGCGDAAPAPAVPSRAPVALPSVPAVTVSAYLRALQDGSTDAGSDHRLVPGHTPQPVLLAAGRDACTGFHRRGNAGDAWALLEQKGWSQDDAMSISMAAAISRLCDALHLGPGA
ncbi:glyoxylase-like metal-dependent hydrolase (beta-lactamase superfamily II) [Streptacidiphilus sp. MAP12-33]|uniref:DUF732 domain-containing protein n=1 Tax=Streptacidiphilus sp. MAP12-33 TaxID=3156266 RepID=UPI003517AAB2